MSLPSPEGIPKEMETGSLPYSMPPETKSMQVRVQPSNISSIVSNTYTLTASQAGVPVDFPIQNLIFDLPCGQSPSQFLDSRQSTISFRATYEIVNGGSSALVGATDGYLRSHAGSFFDRMYVVSQNGQIIEDINEFGLVQDTIINLQMNNSSRDGVGTAYGFASAASLTSQGHALGIFAATRTLATGNTESHSYSIPLVSGSIGVCADSFINIGRTSKMQCVLQTTGVAPISICTGTATTAATFRITLSDFTLQLAYVDIGARALSMLDNSLVGGKSYIHGITYRTSTNTLPATSGSVSLLAGLRGSSVKSLFARFHDTPLTAAGSINHKYDSKNPMASQIGFNIGGQRYPPIPVNALLQPSLSFRELQSAIGSFNSTEYSYGAITDYYCKLSAGGTAQGLASTTQDYAYNLGTTPLGQSLFMFGTNTEDCAKRGVLSGLNCNASPIFLELNISTAPTNTHNVYVIGQLDQILVHDVMTGDIQVRV
jgi:hypothetical protein